MGKVSFNISMSLDGYINGPDVTPEQVWAGAATSSTNGPSTATRRTAS
jgi:hypothetical protein